MSAVFSIHDFVCWCSNATLQTYLQRLCFLATEPPAIDHKLLGWLQHQQNSFHLGAVVSFDEVLDNRPASQQFLELFDRATNDLLNSEEFTTLGKEWLQCESPKLRARILASVE